MDFFGFKRSPSVTEIFQHAIKQGREEGFDQGRTYERRLMEWEAAKERHERQSPHPFIVPPLSGLRRGADDSTSPNS